MRRSSTTVIVALVHVPEVSTAKDYQFSMTCLWTCRLDCKWVFKASFKHTIVIRFVATKTLRNCFSFLLAVETIWLHSGWYDRLGFQQFKLDSRRDYGPPTVITRSKTTAGTSTPVRGRSASPVPSPLTTVLQRPTTTQPMMWKKNKKGDWEVWPGSPTYQTLFKKN